MQLNSLKHVWLFSIFVGFFTASGYTKPSNLTQIIQPVKWSVSFEKTTETEGNIKLIAKIEQNWYLYASTADPVFLPLEVEFVKNNNYETVGKFLEPKPEEKYEEIMGGTARYFKGTAEFSQKIKLKTNNSFSIKIIINGQACSEENGVCIPIFDEEVILKIEGTSGNTETEVINSPSTQAESNIPENEAPQNESLLSPNTNVIPQKLSNEALAALDSSCGEVRASGVQGKSLWGIFIAGFLGGLLALLTPCVFPIIPMTVAFFTKQSTSKIVGFKNAFLFAISIILIYTILGFAVTRIFGPDTLNKMASDGFFNFAFFLIFVLFALSFFGAFEITLPSGFVNKVDQAAGRGGLIGIFFMAFTLSLVSFSCTGPIIGTLLVEAAIRGSTTGPLVGMFGFSLALALPFALFAAFPAWLSNLPKSGGWLNMVKISLGFLELALAIKFLSNVDLAYHWGILKREIFIVLWVAIFAIWGLYLLGKISFASDSNNEKVTIPRLILSIFIFAFTIYLVPGLWGAPLKLVSGFAPPSFYVEWQKESNNCPHNLDCYKDFDKGMKAARAQNKPVIIDFTGWACVNCRKMEDNVWSDPRVLKLLSSEYILISLYVDDKASLPVEEQYVSTFSGKKIRTVGSKWSDFQAMYYNSNSQPLYILVDTDGQLLAEPYDYDPDINRYVNFLESGLCRFRKR